MVSKLQSTGRFRFTSPALGLPLLLAAAACTPTTTGDDVSVAKGAVVYGSDTRRNYYEASTTEKSWLKATALVTSFENIKDGGTDQN